MKDETTPSEFQPHRPKIRYWRPSNLLLITFIIAVVFLNVLGENWLVALFWYAVGAVAFLINANSAFSVRDVMARLFYVMNNKEAWRSEFPHYQPLQNVKYRIIFFLALFQFFVVLLGILYVRLW